MKSAGKRSTDRRPPLKARENMQPVLRARDLFHIRERVAGEKRGKTFHRPATTAESAGKHTTSAKSEESVSYTGKSNW